MIAATRPEISKMTKLAGASSSATIGAKMVANFEIVTHTPQAVDVKIVG